MGQNNNKNKCSCGNKKCIISLSCRKCYLKNRNPVTYKKGKENPNFKNGCIRRYGHRLIRVNGKYIFEHRKIMEDYLGRKLNNNEDVHHINGNPLDNRIENLEVLTKSQHRLLHIKIKGEKDVRNV